MGLHPIGRCQGSQGRPTPWGSFLLETAREAPSCRQCGGVAARLGPCPGTHWPGTSAAGLASLWEICLRLPINTRTNGSVVHSPLGGPLCSSNVHFEPRFGGARFIAPPQPLNCPASPAACACAPFQSDWSFIVVVASTRTPRRDEPGLLGPGGNLPGGPSLWRGSERVRFRTENRPD